MSDEKKGLRELIKAIENNTLTNEDKTFLAEFNKDLLKFQSVLSERLKNLLKIDTISLFATQSALFNTNLTGILKNILAPTLINDKLKCQLTSLSKLKKERPDLYEKWEDLPFKEAIKNLENWEEENKNKTSEIYPMLIGQHTHKALSKDEIKVKHNKHTNELNIDLNRFGAVLVNPDMFASQEDLEAQGYSLAINMQRDLKYTANEQKLFDYCVMLAYLNGNTGAFLFAPDKALEDFGKKPLTREKDYLGKSFNNLLNKKFTINTTVKLKGLDYKVKIEDVALIMENGKVEMKETILDGKPQTVIKSGRFIFDPEIYKMINEHFHYAKGQKGAFLLTDEQYLIYKCFIEKSRYEKDKQNIKLSYLSVIEYVNLTDTIKTNPSRINCIFERLEAIKEKGLFIDFYISYHDVKQEPSWYKKETISKNKNTELNKSVLKEYIINVKLPDVLINSLENTQIKHKKIIEKSLKKKKPHS